MGVLQLGLGLFLFMRGAPDLSAAQVGLLGLLEVILAPIWVWLAFDEVPAPLSLDGGAVVLAALIVHSVSVSAAASRQSAWRSRSARFLRACG